MTLSSWWIMSDGLMVCMYACMYVGKLLSGSMASEDQGEPTNLLGG